MLLYALRRLGVLLPILLVISFITFLLNSLMPGDPARQIAGPDASEETLAQIRERDGLDDPFLVQYGRWLTAAVRLDFGVSRLSRNDVVDEIAARLPATLGMVVLAVLISIAIAVPVGLFAGTRPKGLFDNFSGLMLGIALAVPNFVLAILLVLVLAVNRGWFPLSGYVPLSEDPWQWFSHMILPAFTLAAFLAAVLARQLRAAMTDTLEKNYVRAAWARGGSAKRVIGQHSFRNASIPAVTVLGTYSATMLGSTVLVEQIFSIPGLGTYLLAAILGSDVPALQGVVIVFVIAQVCSALLVDLLYGLLNPKLRVA